MLDIQIEPGILKLSDAKHSCSVHALHKKLLMGESFQRGRNAKNEGEDVHWHLDPEIVQAIWMLVRICGSDDANSIRPLVSDFVSRVSFFTS